MKREGDEEGADVERIGGEIENALLEYINDRTVNRLVKESHRWFA
tara:strand:+ start:4673 stop:4807 length:135 start_codon:yes stop_codon:yes gene_type:complete